ncbi:MAG: hypothetical protein IJF84_02025 [Thermoguttaceae bacterium]|nr:hypothetical protein [Thermoguttaceae bacterium]
MFKMKNAVFSSLLLMTLLLVNAFANEQQSSTSNVNAPAQPQAAVASTDPGSDVPASTTVDQTATPPVEQTTQSVPPAPAEQEKAPSSWQAAWSGWAAAGLLVVIIVLLIRNGRAAKKTLGNPGEEPEDDIPDTKDKKLPFIGNPELILNNERFAPGSELFTEAQKLAGYRTERFMNALDNKLGSNANQENPVDCNTLQSIANSLQPEFVDDLCKPGCVWMQKIFGTNAVPEYLPLYIRSLFKPILVPEGSKLKLEVPAAAVGIMAALGAIIGAWIIGLFAWTGGMKQPGDMTTLLGAAVGAGLFSWLIFWATANETVRKTLEITVGAVAAVDAAATIVSSFINIGSFFGVKKTIQGGFFKRLFLYAACWFVLHLMKRPVVFDRQDYRNKLNALYFERIQSIVLFLASSYCISENDRKVLNDEQNRWAKKVSELEAEIKTGKLGNKYIGIMYPRVRSLWNLDIRNLEAQLRSLAQDFISLGFDLPKSERMHFTEQLDALIQNQNGVAILPEKPEPVKQERRRFIWSNEFKDQFDRIGLVDPGDEVIVLDEPLIQNGDVIKKGNVQCSDDYSEL